MLWERQEPVFTKHVLNRLSRRGVKKKDVREVFQNHHTTYPGTNTEHDTIVLVGTARGERPLKVVVDKRRRRVVVTAMWGDV